MFVLLASLGCSMALRRARLRKLALLAACAAGCALSPLTAAARVDHRANRPHPAVARIIVPEGEATSFGSGTLIDARDNYGLVITNWHVVRDAQGPIEVLFPNGYHSKARALKVDADWDLAALVIWRPEIEPVSLAERAPQPGDELTICGYGHGVYRAATGRCTQYYAPEVNLPRQMVELDVQARQGDSGGPIFNNRGELAGVLFGAGKGTTLGSFGGRVETFLASLAPDIGQKKEAQFVVQAVAPLEKKPQQQAEHKMDGEVANQAVASIGEDPPSPKLSSLDEPSIQNKGDAWHPVDRRVASLWNETRTPDEGVQEPNVAPTRSRWFANVKSALAAIGAIAIAIQVVRIAR